MLCRIRSVVRAEGYVVPRCRRLGVMDVVGLCVLQLAKRLGGALSFGGGAGAPKREALQV